LGGLAVFAAVFFSTLVPTLLGTVCGMVGLRREPVHRRLAVTALVLNGLPCGLCVAFWLLPLVIS
jgi:hypothetical protein